MKSIIIYHKQDCDGIVGAAVLYKGIKNIYSYDCLESLGGDYTNNEEIMSLIKNWMLEEKVMIYIVDYSLDPKDIKELLKNENCQFIAWFDHHVSAIESYLKEKLIKQIDGSIDEYESAVNKMYAYCTPKHSGCYNAYMGMFGTTPKKKSIVNLISIFDCWQKDSELWFTALYLNQYMQQYVRGQNYGIISDIIDSNDEEKFISDNIEKGELIFTAMQEAKTSYAETAAFDLMFEGIKFKAINSTPGGSFVVQYVATEEHEALLQFCWKRDHWSVSMYHNPYNSSRPDLSKIAVKYGGGGHPGACGFSTRELPFELSYSR